MYCFIVRRRRAWPALATSGGGPERVSELSAEIIDSLSPADVDRVLGLADQFLEDWAEDAVQSGRRDVDYKQRSSERSAMRPLLLAAPELLQGMKHIVSVCEGSPHPLAQACNSLARTAMSNLIPRT